MRDSRQLLRNASGISLATMMSRVLGLVRDQVQSYFFGAGMVTDAFVAAFRIPNLLRDLFAEGALSAAFVPTFTRERVKRGDAAAFGLANRLLTILGVILSVVAVAIFVFARPILSIYVPGFEGEQLDLAVQMTRIVSPFLLFVAFAAVAMGMLNTHGRFFLPALAPASFNVAAIAGVIVLVPLYSAGRSTRGWRWQPGRSSADSCSSPFRFRRSCAWVPFPPYLGYRRPGAAQDRTFDAAGDLRPGGHPDQHPRRYRARIGVCRGDHLVVPGVSA